MHANQRLGILMPERTKQIALAWSILRESHLAEDAYQDMLAKAFAREEPFDDAKHLRDWSWKVLRNRCYELLRQKRSRAALLEDDVLERVDAELHARDTSDFDARADALRACLGALTANARNIVSLRFFEGLRGNQVAERLGRKPDAVYKALQRIYQTLGSCIRSKLAASEPGNPIL